MQGFLLTEIHHFSNSINKKVRSKSTALFIFKGENYFLPNCGKTESFRAVNKPT